MGYSKTSIRIPQVPEKETKQENERRGCADDHSQQEYITKKKLGSPTVSLYALMGSCVMDALDDRKVITVDIPGTFLQGDWPQKEHPGCIMFEGIMVDMICEIAPSYYKNVI